jgi:hypothetical protein
VDSLCVTAVSTPGIGVRTLLRSVLSNYEKHQWVSLEECRGQAAV